MAEYLDKLFKSDDPRRYWLAIADLDDFKTVNDTYGHNCGDLVLSTIASPLDNNLGRTLACRWGGEEFLLVGPIDQDMESQRKQLERVRRVIADQPIWYEEHLINVTITMGLAACQEGYTVKERIKVADEKPYEGKTHGKNQIVM